MCIFEHHKILFSLMALATALSFAACDSGNDSENTLFVKKNTSQSHIDFSNDLNKSTELNILNYLYYYNGAGVAAADFNNDAQIDLYFTSNQGADKIYINKGNLTFQETTNSSGIKNDTNWTTGVTHVDINQDGLLDIYVCKMGDFGNVKGKNLLYINMGIDENGIPTFVENSKKYGLDFSGFSTQASFFDFDLDGDLDLFLLNHSVFPNRTYGKGNLRKTFDKLSGDRFFRNDNGTFTDITNQTGIFQGKIGYGLGVAVSDINNDGYPDLYIGNDFFENDYLYVNQGNGSFREIISKDSQKLGHTTHFSMGNDIADINNDGRVDILSLDMLPQNLETYKTSGLEYPYSTYQNFLKNGYSPQFMQNNLHLNRGNFNFSEIATLAGVSATEWSWSALLADYDNDGLRDIFITNGIKGATNDMDFINFIANEKIQKRLNTGMSIKELAFIDEIPEKKVTNYFFKNNGDLTFKNVSKYWNPTENSFSNGSTYADLDNDGDLDIVVNNINEKAYLLENTTISTASDSTVNKSISFEFKGSKKNRDGIGAKVYIYSGQSKILGENYVNRGYLSAVPPTVHFGIGNVSVVDSAHVIWPSGRYQTLKGIQTNQKIIVAEASAEGNFYDKSVTGKSKFVMVTDSVISFRHKEKPTLDFDRNQLIPYASTNEGPQAIVGDINLDGLDDIFIGGAKQQASELWIQDNEGNFTKSQHSQFEEDANAEDISQIFFDANGDEWVDLLVVSGGNEYTGGTNLRPRLYINNNGIFIKDNSQFENIATNASKVEAVDFDNDGDFDIAITADQIPQQFGKSPVQYLFQNNGRGSFNDITSSYAPGFRTLGAVKDMKWVDLDENGFVDLIAVGHWMPISIFMNTGTSLKLQTKNGLSLTNGWWNTLSIADFDNDGDLDLIGGNWGLNSKLKASESQPMRLYSYDFDNNGSVEPIVTYHWNGIETPFASKDELVKQIPSLNKAYLSYKNFAAATIGELFSSEKLNKAYKKEVFELGSLYFENIGGEKFIPRRLPIMAQASTIRSIMVDDIDKDGFLDLLLVGNDHEISTQLGRMDASHGLILLNNRSGFFDSGLKPEFDVKGAARNITKIRIGAEPHYLITINNSSPIVLKKKKNAKTITQPK